MKGLIRFVVRFRWLVLAVSLLITIWLGYHAAQLEINADFSTYLDKESELVKNYDRVGEEFGGKSMSFLILESDQQLNADVLRLVRELTRKIEGSENVSYVTSLTNVIDFKSTDYGLEVGKLLTKAPGKLSSAEVQELWRYVLSKKMYRGSLLTDDLTSTAILIRLAPGTDEYRFTGWLAQTATETVNEYPSLAADVKPYVGGMPSLMYSMTNLIIDNLTILLPLMVGLILLVLVIGFRRPGGVLMPMTDVLISTVWAMGVVQLLGYDVNLLVGIMPIILLAMGSADGIHIMKSYYEHRYGGKSPRTAIIDAGGELGVPVLITSITTAVGFGSLFISDFEVIRQFGIATAIAILVALVVTILIIPTLISFARDIPLQRPFRKKRASVSSVSEKAARLITGHPGKIVVGAAVLLLIFTALIPFLRKDVDWSLCLAKGSDPYHADMILREKYGGSLPVQVVVDGHIKDPAVLQQIFLTENYLESLPLVNQPLGIGGVIAEMNYVMNGRYTIPETRQEIENLWFLVEGEDLMAQIVANNDQSALIQGKMGTMDTRYLVREVEKINRYLKTVPGRPETEPLTPENQSILLNQVLNLIVWNAREEGLAIDSAKVRAAVEKVYYNQPSYREAILDGIQNYLLSSGSEVNFTPERRAGQIAQAVTNLWESKSPLTADDIEMLLSSNRFRINEDDAYYLSRSLAKLIPTLRGTVLTGTILAELRPLFPRQALENKDFMKESTGALWLLNRNQVLTLAPAGPESPSLAVTHTGLPPILKHMEEELTPTQVESVLFALLFIALLFGLIFRSWKIGVLGIVPLILTIMMNFGVMSSLGIGLDSFTAMIASIAIGLGVDYAVHFTSRFKRETERLKDLPAALAHTFQTTGRAIIINALSVGSGFAVLLLAGGQHIRRFGGLTSLTMIVAALFTLVVLPAVYLYFKPAFVRNTSQAAGEAQEEIQPAEETGEIPQPVSESH